MKLVFSFKEMSPAVLSTRWVVKWWMQMIKRLEREKKEVRVLSDMSFSVCKNEKKKNYIWIDKDG